ncbi:uncharacterized protein [Amphiura filiformis]|uniref:uncharacterized protein n=1 Tax=Amphiura filiformis TaxID=82378 RepID=UPI003B21BDD8
MDLSFKTFEMSCVKDSRTGLILISIYRPYPSSVNKLRTNDFLKDFDSLLDEVSSLANKVLIFGDLNIHVNRPAKPEVCKFMNSLCTNGFNQHVTKPTHKLGNTLDLIISRVNDVNIIVDWDVKIPPMSDHFIVTCKLDYIKPDLPKTYRTLRNFRDFDNQVFAGDLASSLSKLPHSDNVNNIVSSFSEICTNLLDKYAPLSTKLVAARCRLPWYNEEIRKAKRVRRRSERKWRKSGSEHDRSAYLDQVHHVSDLILQAKTKFFKSKLANANSKDLFSTVNGLLNRSGKCLPIHESAAELADKFACFFKSKIDKISAEFDIDICIGNDSMVQSSGQTTDTLTCFVPALVDEFETVIGKLANKSCNLDPLPTWILKQNVSVVSPIVTKIVNASLRDGIFLMHSRRPLLHLC